MDAVCLILMNANLDRDVVQYNDITVKIKEVAQCHQRLYVFGEYGIMSAGFSHFLGEVQIIWLFQ